MGWLSWANWKWLCWWIMGICLIQALCYGSLWYVQQVDGAPPTPESRSAPESLKPEPPKHPVIREPLSPSHMTLVCDYIVREEHPYGTEEYWQEIRRADCEGREIP